MRNNKSQFTFGHVRAVGIAALCLIALVVLRGQGTRLYHLKDSSSSALVSVESFTSQWRDHVSESGSAVELATQDEASNEASSEAASTVDVEKLKHWPSYALVLFVKGMVASNTAGNSGSPVATYITHPFGDSRNASATSSPMLLPSSRSPAVQISNSRP